MKRLQFLLIVLVTACMCSLSVADDGAINNKSMSRTIQLPDFGQDIVNQAVPEAEHAFTDMMNFYVPAQQASGLLTLVDYCDIDNTPAPGEDCTNPVETLEVAKPLINVFLFGPAFGVHGTAFAHSFMDVYAAVSLDDGETWKQTNLSESADLTSFNIGTDHIAENRDPLPPDHNILLGSRNNGAFHALGYDKPFTYHCTECHGPALTGTAQAPSCYSCHGSRWKEEPFEGVGPIIYEAVYKNSKVEGSGENAGERSEVTIVNGATGDELWTTEATLTGTFHFLERPAKKEVPCTVAAIADDEEGPATAVVDKNGEPIENCAGFPVTVTDYPGGAHNVFHATAGNKVLVAWPSRFCQMGQPAYQMTTETNPDLERLTAVVDFLQAGNTDLGVGSLPDFDMTDDLYLLDAFGVAGSQKSSDFADEGYPQAGVVPYGCLWTARGVLLPGDDPRTADSVESSHMVWTKAERLTSGRRDPNRIEVRAVKDAGFVITWQEDPEGLRPGQGLGPGEGWSGAIAHPQTDVWYSFINYEYFDIVEDPAATTTPVNILNHDLTESGRPQVYVPMSVPMRLTNNAKCNAPVEGVMTDDLYCNFELAAPYGLRDQCADILTIITGPPDGETETSICVADSFDGIEGADLVNRANTASTRPRLGLQGYDPSAEDKSAWVIVAMEESKGLGKFFFEPDGLADGFDGYADPCDEGSSLTCSEEIGKNQWYYSFDMGTPDTSAGIGNPYSLVSNLVSQGNMLNQPEVYWETGEFYGLMDTAEMGEGGTSLYGDYDFQIANTEIARRASLLVQGIGKAQASANGLVAIPSWKQGVMRQGGPADTMFRRIVLPVDFDPTSHNPYDFENMVCGEWYIDPGTNPYYPDGLCGSPATNLSGVVPDTCWDDGTGAAVDCPQVTFDGSLCAVSAGGTFGCGDTNPILRGVVQGEGNQTRVLTWHQCPTDGVATENRDFDPVTCDTDLRTDDFVNLLDQSWYNPLDISKGHRGFIDGDFVMFLYAWSPTWRLNAKGNDRYELYVRRSFDGGQTWGTTPPLFLASDGLSYPGDGTITCESYRPEPGTSPPGERVEPKVCYSFAAGAAEHARNVTQHRSMNITTLDPRYAPSRASIAEGCLVGLMPDVADAPDLETDYFWGCDDSTTDYASVVDSDLRDPSRYFMVFETGDNKTVEVGEAEPLDLFYSRAESFGDDYVVWTETDTGFDADPTSVCYPTVAYDVNGVVGTVLEGSGFCNEFENMNTGGDTHSSEANLEANPDGSKLYGVWGQWVFDENDPEEIDEADAQARRVWWIDLYRSDTEAYTLPGTGQP